MLRPALFSSNKPAFFEDSFDNFFDDAFRSFLGNNELSALSGFNTDILDEGDYYALQAELPGFKKEDININLEDGLLTISATHNEESSEKGKKNYLRKERHYSSYTRSFHVEGVDASDIDASYENGILEVKFPKKELSAKEESKRIEVK